MRAIKQITTELCAFCMVPTACVFISAMSVEFEVQVLISDTRYDDVSQEERVLMNKCLVLPAPLPTGIDLERPCVSPAIGQYMYVVMVLFNAAGSTMGINEFRVYSSECCKKKCDLVDQGVQKDTALLIGLVFYLWLNKVSFSKRKRYVCNIFPNWLGA